MDGRLASSALHCLVAAPAYSGEGLSATPWVQRAGSCVVGAAVMGGARLAGRWMQGMHKRCARASQPPQDPPSCCSPTDPPPCAHVDEACEAVGATDEVPLPAAYAGCVLATAQARLGAGAGVGRCVHRST